jgi:hypothetical protein
MIRAIHVSGLAMLVLLLTLLAAVPAHAEYEFDPVLSLTGDCSVSVFDPVADPSCPYALPNAPAERFTGPRAIAIDPYGNEYVASYAESVDVDGRVDVFDDEGKFVTEVSAPNPKSIAVDGGGHLYVYEDNGKVVRYSPEDSLESPYDPEAGKIAYEDPAVTVSTGSAVGALAVDVADRLLVASGGTISIRASAEAGNGVLESFEPSGLGPWTDSIAVDSLRKRIYVSGCKNESDECFIGVVEADAPHAVVEEIDGSTTPAGAFVGLSGRLGIAGDFFIADLTFSVKTVYQFNEGYEYMSQIKSSEFQANTGTQIAISNGERAGGDAANRHALFVPKFVAAGRAIAFKPGNVTPPVIEEVATGSIGETEVELQATIFPAGLDTEYVLEYMDQEVFEEQGDFEGAVVVDSGTVPGKSQATEVSALATGFTPGESYRFRVVAENESGKAPEKGQNEATFATYDDSSVPGSCPNDGLRVGLSGRLPDCRVYELVTPPETNGRPPKGIGFGGSQFDTVFTSPDGNAVSFKIEGGSLPGSSGVGAFEGDPYLSTRGPDGWSSALTGPIGDEATLTIPASTSPDQGYFFWTALNEGSAVINGESTEYLTYPGGHSELIGRGSLGYDPKAAGKLITENASHVVFETINEGPTDAIQLEPDAPPTGTEAVYDRTIELSTGAEVTYVVSLLPGEETPAAGQNATYLGASKDGEGIAFAIGSKLYLRVGNEASYEVGENVTFAGVSEGGERIFYAEGGDLLAFDTSTEEVIEFSATGDAIPVNVATEGTRAYFVSPSVLGGVNPEGDSAQAGKQNLYLSEEGAISFVATVTNRDVEGELIPFDIKNHDGLGLWVEVLSGQLAKDPSRLTPDGSVLLFQSRAEITGYAASEFPQIYRYDSVAEVLRCISCIPTKRPATGGASLETYTFDSTNPPPFSPSGFVPNLTTDGKRVFFESTEALVSTDTDEVQDVYEWEEEEVGGCTRPGGCVYLISRGQSGRDNFLYAHSTSGDDVFFTTSDILTRFDGNSTTSIYDAKVGGGFPAPEPADPCVADGCRPALAPAPALPSRVSVPQGAGGNVSAKTCPKGKRKVKKNGKVRCVKRKRKGKVGKAKDRAGADRGTGK